MAGRVVVVTGGSAGVGRAVARAFAEAGDRVAVLARGEKGLQQTLEEIEGLGGTALVIPCDVADATDVQAAADRVEDQFGPIDVWVNNAMSSVLAFVHDLDPDEVRRVTEVTYLGSVNGILAVLPRMRARDRGTIIQIGSALAYRSIPLQAAYCGAKAATRGFIDSLRTELLAEDSGIRLTMVNLPGLNTPQFSWVRARVPNHPRPVPPVYQPEIAADAVVWAADHPRRELNVGYVTTMTIWGHKLLPHLADRYLARDNVEAQQTDEPLDPDRPDYLFEPTGDAPGAHGVFGDEAQEYSLHLDFTRQRNRMAAAAAVVAVGAGIVRRVTR